MHVYPSDGESATVATCNCRDKYEFQVNHITHRGCISLTRRGDLMLAKGGGQGGGRPLAGAGVSPEKK
jgi:hypothetical protein